MRNMSTDCHVKERDDEAKKLSSSSENETIASPQWQWDFFVVA